jgi:hypothetical protein
MKIIFVNRPLQDENTLEPQVIDGQIYQWCVKSELSKLGETLQQFIERKLRLTKNKDVNAVFIYDVQALIEDNSVTQMKLQGGLIIRYQLKVI